MVDWWNTCITDISNPSLIQPEFVFSAGWGTKEAENVFSHTSGGRDDNQV